MLCSVGYTLSLFKRCTTCKGCIIGWIRNISIGFPVKLYTVLLKLLNLTKLYLAFTSKPSFCFLKDTNHHIISISFVKMSMRMQHPGSNSEAENHKVSLNPYFNCVSPRLQQAKLCSEMRETAAGGEEQSYCSSRASAYLSE